MVKDVFRFMELKASLHPCIKQSKNNAMRNLKNASSNFNELLFENRNKNYGAYVIRKEYNESLIKSFFAAMLLLLIFAGGFSAMNRNNSETVLPATKQMIDQLIIDVDLSYLKKTNPPVTHPTKTIEQAKPFNNENKVVPLVVKDVVLPAEEKKIAEPVSEPGIAQTTPDLGLSANAIASITSEPAGSLLSENKGNILESAGLDALPEFPGGEAKLMEFLARNVKFPASARENGIHGTVHASFVVDEFGKVTQVKIKRGIFSDCDEEVIRVINLFPDFKPGMYKGKNVAVFYNLPVRFELVRN